MPVTINPDAWMLTLPLTLLLTWLWFEPRHSTLRRIWDELMRCETEAFEWIGLTQGEHGLVYARIGRTLYLVALIACGGASLLSLGAALGLLPTAI